MIIQPVKTITWQMIALLSILVFGCFSIFVYWCHAVPIY